MSDSAGTRLGRMLASEPELTQRADQRFLDQWAWYVHQEGFRCAAVLRRLEILKCETIVSGETFSQVLERLTASDLGEDTSRPET